MTSCKWNNLVCLLTLYKMHSSLITSQQNLTFGLWEGKDKAKFYFKSIYCQIPNQSNITLLPLQRITTSFSVLSSIAPYSMAGKGLIFLTSFALIFFFLTQIFTGRKFFFLFTHFFHLFIVYMFWVLGFVLKWQSFFIAKKSTFQNNRFFYVKSCSNELVFQTRFEL